MELGLGLSLTHNMPTKAFSKSAIDNKLGEDAVWYYTLEDFSGDRPDLSVNNLTLSEIGSVNQEPGVIDFAAKFAGVSNNHLTHVTDPIYNFSSKDFTIAGWFKLATKATNQHLINVGNGNDTTSENVFNVRYNTSNDNLHIRMSDGTNQDNCAVDLGGSIPTGQFIFFCFRYNFADNVLECRLDNQQFTVNQLTLGPLRNPGTQSLSVGAQVNGGNPLDGALDEIQAYHRFLSVTEVDHLYNIGVGRRPNFDFVSLFDEDETNELFDDDETNLLTT